MIPSRRNYQMFAANDPSRMEWMIAIQGVVSALIADEEKTPAVSFAMGMLHTYNITYHRWSDNGSTGAAV